jgi:hypothetical protein
MVSYAQYIIDRNINLPTPLPEDPFAWALNILIHSTDQFGGWGKHVQCWTEHPATAFIVRYEDLVQQSNQANLIRSIAKKFSLKVPFNAFWSHIPKFSAFHQKYPRFYREGKVGTWKKEMPVEYQLQFWEKYGPMMEKLGYMEQ